jgi:serine/threonine protein kinase
MSSLSSISQGSTNYQASVAEATGQADSPARCSGSFGLRAFSKISGSDSFNGSSAEQVPSERGSKRILTALSLDLNATYKRICSPQARKTETVPQRFQLCIQSQTGTDRLYNIDLQKLIGQGSNGAVFQASVSTGAPGSEKMYALKVSKIFPDNPQATRRSQQALIREVKILTIWNKINPQGELSLAQMWYGPFRVDPDRIGCLQALYGSSVLNYLQHKTLRNIFTLKIIRAAAFELVEALGALERAGIIHADIKPENIVVNQEGNKFYIIDAGNNEMCPEGQCRPNETKEYVVSRWYRPPEVVFHKPYGHAADRWSLMCVLFEMHTGEPLFPAPDTQKLKNMFTSLLGPAPEGYITDGITLPASTVDLGVSKKAQFSDLLDAQLISKSENVEEERAFKAFLEGTLKWEQSTRLTVAEMMGHPFINCLAETAQDATEAQGEVDQSSQSAL